MAPGRRRGAKGAKSKSELNLGDLVLAKVKGHPAWPAKISRPEDWDKAPDPKKCFVHFFGTNEIAFVLPADIQAFTIEAKSKVLARCKGKTVKYFAKAVKEICEEFEELQQKSSSGTGTDTDKHDSESEGPSIHGMDDDAKVTGLQRDTEMKALEDEGCVLGRCSRSQEGDASGGGEADGSSPASMSGQKEVTNGNKSKKIIPGSKRKLEGDVQSEKITGAVGSLRRDKIHLEGADDRWKDTKGTFKEKVGRNVNPVKRSNSEDVAVDLAKGSVQRNRESGVLDSKAGDAKNRLPPRATAGSFDTNAAPSDDSVLQPAKRRRQDSMAGSSTRSSIDKTGKGFTALRNDSKKVKSPPVSQFPPKRRAVRLYDDDDEEEPKTPVHGGSFRKADAPSRVLDLVKSTSAHGERSIHEQAPGAHEDGSSKVLPSSTVKPLSELLSPSSRQHVVRPKRASTLATYVSSSPEKIESDKMLSNEAGPVLVSPMRSPLAVGVAKPVVDPIRVNKTPVKVSDNVSQRKTHSGANKNTHVVSEPVLDLPMRSPLSVAVAKPVVELVRVNKPPVRVSDNISQRKFQPGANKNTLVVSDGLDHSPNHGLNERSKGVFSVEGQKNTPKSGSRMNDSALVAGKLTEINSSTGERLQRDKKSGREDKTSVLTDSKIEDSAMSMKHLIAVAQARRKEAHSQSVLFHGSDVTGGSPILVSNSVQSILLSGGANSMMMHPDMQGNYQAQTSFPTSPASHIHHFSSNNNHPETEEFEDRRVSSGHRSTAGGSLSGGTEAAVARDAFEGMIETLSRTKESIGRATRLAIDCAKYGIASEVVELLIRKLETEPSLHRKVDLFFLVDSITQCSHGQKGIAGASYIPTVQAALPRLLGAAAPPGTVARENRKQCLKVLRLWLERKILPESLLRHYIDDIGVSNDDTSAAGVFLRRPSRAERAIDDPVREMDGMLVDEYGSNSTSQLLGLLSSRDFDEEEEEEEQNQDLSRDLCKVDGDRSPVEPTCTVGETEEFAVTPSDSRRHCILQDVDGELEMEDVSTYPKDERGFSAGLNFEMVSEGEGQGRIFEEGQNSFTELTPPQEDSPPLPLDSPPPTPPLPSSPPPPSPPPPPPSSPSPPPPPPPPLPSQAHMHPPPPAGMPLSLVPQPPTLPHHIHPFQSSLPSSSPSLAYQPLAPPSGSQTVQVAGNAPRGPHIDVNMRNGMFPQPPAFFVPSGPSGYNNSARPAVDYVVRNDLYANPQTSQPNQQQFQPGLPPLTQRPPFHPAPPPQAPSSQFSYSKPTTVQQIPQQQPYPPQYSVVPTHPDGTNWRMPANEFSSTDNQHGLWINGGRNSSGSVPSFPQEGYFRPPLNRPPSNNLSFQPPPERPPSNNASFQPPAVNTLPAGPPIPAAGHVGPQMVPIRPDFSTLGSWRPA